MVPYIRVSGGKRSRTVETDASALLTGTGTHIHYPVRRPHCLLVVFHHHHRIAAVPEFLERIDEFYIIPLVQAYGRFVKDVEHIHEFGADLSGKSYSLALPARKRRRGPVQ